MGEAKTFVTDMLSRNELLSGLAITNLPPSRARLFANNRHSARWYPRTNQSEERCDGFVGVAVGMDRRKGFIELEHVTKARTN